jgi:glucose-6-phosphate 1-dehydrogenase
MSVAFVVFSGVGDLAWRKPTPAKYQAFRRGMLPEGG